MITQQTLGAALTASKANKAETLEAARIVSMANIEETQ